MEAKLFRSSARVAELRPETEVPSSPRHTAMSRATAPVAENRVAATAALPLLSEDAFQRFLLLERRRCERGGGQFALMLVDFSSIGSSVAPQRLEEVGGRIATVLRDTDIPGWYRRHRTLGVLLTALNESGRSVVEPVLISRTMEALSSALSSEDVDRVRVNFYFFPDRGVDGVGDAETREVFYPEASEKGPRGRAFHAMKRTIDIVGSLTALILCSPAFVAVALAIRWTSDGPVFFRQTRVGRHGKQFTFLKFRSMRIDSDPAIHREYVKDLIRNNVRHEGGSFKIQDDPRVTPVGRFIRKTSIDELPQFINVLRGDMSLVGPRPPIPYETEDYALWHRRRVLEAKPGITGEWQVYGRSRTTFDEMVRMDLRYIRRQSLWVDLGLLIRTPLAVFRGHGAY